jgi:hypothetical protein
MPVNANPYLYHEFVTDPTFVKPPTITILSPKQNEVYSGNGTIVLCFNVTGPDSPSLLTKYLSMVDYKGDWMQEAEHAYRTKNFETYTPDDFPFSLSFNFSVTGIPMGKHSLVITAFGSGGYAEELTWYQFSRNNSLSVNFTIAKTPIISFLSFENTVFHNSEVSLNFTVDQSILKAAYSLDGGKTVALNGNTTLTGLSIGYHNITVYATNEFDETGASETINFIIASSNFPTAIFVGLFVTSAIAVGAAFIYVRKMRDTKKQRRQQTWTKD